MVADPAAWKTYTKKVFDAVSSGSFDQISMIIGPEFAREFNDPYPALYWLVLKGWNECMKQKYNESMRAHEKIEPMRACLSQRKISINAPVEETLAVRHLNELIDHFENGMVHLKRSFSWP